MANSKINGETSREERAVLEKIRESKPNYDCLSDGTIIRWLRSNGGNLEETLEALDKHVVFRKAWGLDGLWTEWKYSEVVEKYCGFGFAGVDKDGAPVMISMLGNMDIEGVMKSVQSQEYIKWSIRPIEEGVRRCEELAKETGNPFEQLTLVLDLDSMTSFHYSYKPFTNSFLTLVGIFQDHYPLAIKKIIVIRGPSVAQYAYTLLKPFLAERTQQTVEMPGENWLDTILQYVDADEWPAYFGGNKMGEGSSTLPPEITLGDGTVPKKYYLDGEEEMGSGFENITVYAGDKHLVELETKKPCVRLSWQYKTAAEDIGFGIYYDKNASGIYSLMTNVKVDGFDKQRKDKNFVTDLNKERVQRNYDIIIYKSCDVIEFDNYYSWFSAKELAYLIDVQEL